MYTSKVNKLFIVCGHFVNSCQLYQIHYLFVLLSMPTLYVFSVSLYLAVSIVKREARQDLLVNILVGIC